MGRNTVTAENEQPPRSQCFRRGLKIHSRSKADWGLAVSEWFFKKADVRSNSFALMQGHHGVLFPGTGTAVQEVCVTAEEDREMRANSVTHAETIRGF